jgi:PilZ domain
MPDLRRLPRSLAQTTGKVRFKNTTSDFPCAVLSMHAVGACILVSDSIEIPEFLELTIDRDGTSYACRVVWKSERRIGVSFQPNASGQIDNPPLKAGKMP